MNVALARRATAEALGTALLVAAVVGSGIAAQRLAPGEVGLQLLVNSIATGAALVALILALGPVSGAHFNPVVTLADRMLGGISTLFIWTSSTFTPHGSVTSSISCGMSVAMVSCAFRISSSVCRPSTLRRVVGEIARLKPA